MTEHQFVVLLHVIGAGVVIGVAFFSLVSSLDKPVDANKLRSIMFIRRFGTYAVFWQFLTGLHLLTEHGGEIIPTAQFWIKMGLIVADGALAHLVIGKKINAALDKNDMSLIAKLPTPMITSALVILLIVTLGYITSITH